MCFIIGMSHAAVTGHCASQISSLNPGQPKPPSGNETKVAESFRLFVDNLSTCLEIVPPITEIVVPPSSTVLLFGISGYQNPFDLRYTAFQGNKTDVIVGIGNFANTGGVDQGLYTSKVNGVVTIEFFLDRVASGPIEEKVCVRLLSVFVGCQDGRELVEGKCVKRPQNQGVIKGLKALVAILSFIIVVLATILLYIATTLSKKHHNHAYNILHNSDP